MVLGENRPYLAVVAALDPEIWAREKEALAGAAGPGARKAEADFLLARIRRGGEDLSRLRDAARGRLDDRSPGRSN